MAKIDIKAIAKELAKRHTPERMQDAFDSILGEADPETQDCYLIEDGIEDGFLGMCDWEFEIGFTPEVVYGYVGGWSGCDLADCDRVAEEIAGLLDIDARMAAYTDEDGERHELSDSELYDLEMALWNELY